MICQVKKSFIDENNKPNTKTFTERIPSNSMNLNFNLKMDSSFFNNDQLFQSNFFDDFFKKNIFVDNFNDKSNFYYNKKNSNLTSKKPKENKINKEKTNSQSLKFNDHTIYEL